MRQFFQSLNYCGNSKPTSQIYLESFFDTTLDWKEICLMPRKVTVDTFTSMFQYQIIAVFYLNKMLFVYKKVTTPLCSFWKSKDKTPIYFFFDCLVTQNPGKQLCSICRNKLIIPNSTPQSAIFVFFESNYKSKMLTYFINF